MAQIHAILIGFLTIFHFFVSSEIRIHNVVKNSTRTSLIYNALPWDISQDIQQLSSLQEEDDRKSILLIPIDSSFDLYDPCNDKPVKNVLKSYIEKTLEEYGPKFSKYWIALITGNACGGILPIHLYYDTSATAFSQNLGASGLIRIEKTANRFKSRVQAGVDISERVVLGEKINIPALYLLSHSMAIGNPEIQLAVDYPIIVDMNYAEVPKEQPFGLYGLSWLLIGAISLLVSLYVIRRTFKLVVRYFKDDKGGGETPISKIELITVLLILVPEIICGIIRAIVSIDPLGIFNRYDYVAASSAFNIISTLGYFTDIVTVIYCKDMYQIFKCSNSKQKAVPFLKKHKLGGVLLIVFGVVMIVLDQIIIHLTFRLRNLVFGFSLIYQLIQITITTALLFQTSRLMAKQVQIVLQVVESRSNSRGKESNNSNSSNKHSFTTTSNGNDCRVIRSDVVELQMMIHDEELILKSRALLRTRKYIIAAVTGRCFTIIAFIVILFREFSVWLILLCGISSLLSSISQMFNALHLQSHMNFRSNIRVPKAIDAPKEERSTHHKIQILQIIETSTVDNNSRRQLNSGDSRSVIRTKDLASSSKVVSIRTSCS